MAKTATGHTHFPTPGTAALRRPIPYRPIIVAMMGFWTLAMILHVYGELTSGRDVLRRLAVATARTIIDRDILYREWNARSGGVYVPVNDTNQPNPYLANLPERDIVTSEGVRFTLVNPAYMTRQVHELSAPGSEVVGHLTSLRPINPNNAPDPWEKAVLERFRSADEDFSEEILIDGKPLMRMIRPFVVNEGCLRCHASQGYQLGEIRGGISVATPMEPLIEAYLSRQVRDVAGSALLWLLGMGLLASGFVWIHRSENARSREEEKTSSLYRAVEQSPASVVITDLGGHIEYVNPKFTEVTGYSFEEALGRNPRILNSGAHPREYYQDLWRAITAGREWRGEFLNRKKNGETYWEYASISSVKDHQGNITHFLAVKEDITLRKNTEQQLKLQKEFAETVLNSIPDAISIIDVESFRIVEVNEGFLQNLGLARHEVVGRTCFELTHNLAEACAPPDHPCPLTLMRESNAKCVAEHIHVRPDGGRTYMEVSAYPFRDEQGRITQVVHVSRDITQRKMAEQALREAKEQAEAANKAKSEFLANLSHEFRTPMNGIVGLTELLLETPLESEQSEYVLLLKSSADALHTLLNDILDYSKIEAGRLDLEPIPFKLRDSIRDTLHSLSFKARDKNLNLDFKCSPDVPEDLIGDPGRLRQIVLNLVDNAIKFTASGDVSTSVEAESASEDEVVLHFQIKDTGIGIPKEKQALIFEAFTQADASTTRKFGGTGLGLTIVSRLVRLFGGRIWLESEPDRGSAFHFTARFGQATAGLLPPSFDLERLAGQSVLVIDDHPASRRVLSDLIRSWELQPFSAESGPEALSLVRNLLASGQAPAFILLDAQMPGMDGFELAGRLRANDALSKVPIIMLTSGGRRGDAARCLDIGIDGYIPKPVRPPELLDVLRTALGDSFSKRVPLERALITRHSARGSVPRLRVLLAEDNHVNQKLARHLLEKHGHSVVLVSTGREALAAMERAAFDIVLMDIQMPEMDGIEATKIIRQREIQTGSRTRVVAMTAHAMIGDRERFLESGFDGYIAKPIHSAELMNVIRGVAGPVSTEPATPKEEFTDQSIFDLDDVLNRVGHDLGLLREMIEIFLEELPHRLSEIKAAIDAADAGALEASAHSLKGSIGYFSAPAAFAASRRLVEMARLSELSGACSEYARLETETRVLAEVLERFRETGMNEISRHA